MSKIALNKRLYLILSLPLLLLPLASHAEPTGSSTSDRGYTVDPCYKQCAPGGNERLSACMNACQHPGRRAAERCPSGLVWRERFDGDTVCVLPGERDANRRKRGLSVGAASACPSGLVWRERFEGDTVCVTPLERDANRKRRGL